MVGGLNHRLLEVELSSNSIREIPLPDDVLRKFIGGRCLGVWLLWRGFRDSWGALEEYPQLSKEMILEAIVLAAELLKRERHAISVPT